ncbi:hypothetical protein ALC57_09752 [Trachymyrmex cornetzi]|uniref:Uncharacterized protein n=1 Tax=Trachymyrmex cornetzi TaxID=471704 RepID=A0A195DY82_9HYME|nr:hypothetical protein ALC57_09752 [Trachymyrmex cornetzi]
MFEYPFGQPRPFLSCLYTLTTWSFSTYYFYYEFYIVNWENKVLNWIRIIIMITTITLILVSYFHFKKLKMCLRKLSEVDDTLEALGAPKEYQRLRNWIIRIIIGWIVYIFFYMALK